MDAEKLKVSETTDGKPPRPGFESAAAPAPVDPNSGQHQAYWVLSAEERAKGFVRPVRRSYIHVGIAGPKYPLRDLEDFEADRAANDDEAERAANFGYVKFEQYPAGPNGEPSILGRYWTQADLDRVGKGCGSKTTMGVAIAETYARDPHYYGSTFCVVCNRHLPVGDAGEFIWDDGSRERVGT